MSVSHPNGYDSPGEDRAIRAELREVDDRRIEDSRKLTQALSALNTVLDRLAIGLGRIATLEAEVRALGLHLGMKP